MLVICEGIDKTGKSTVADYFESKGYRIIHMKAPPQGQHADNFLQEMLDIVQSATLNDIFLDRSYYGEAFIWPKIYGRTPLLDREGIEILREIENQVGTKRILMTAGSTPELIAAHWQRCVDNNEPLTKKQFSEARNLYSLMAREYGFESVTLPNFCKEFGLDESSLNKEVTRSTTNESPTSSGTSSQTRDNVPKVSIRPLDQRQLLEKANAINDILDKRILKKSGTLYDELENDIRMYLNEKLAAIFGNTEDKPSFTNNEMTILKAMVKRITDKEN